MKEIDQAIDAFIKRERLYGLRTLQVVDQDRTPFASCNRDKPTPIVWGIWHINVPYPLAQWVPEGLAVPNPKEIKDATVRKHVRYIIERLGRK